MSKKKELAPLSALDVRAEAQKELLDELKEKAKSKIKGKLREIDTAKKVLANLDRELVDLYEEIEQDMEDASA